MQNSLKSKVLEPSAQKVENAASATLCGKWPSNSRKILQNPSKSNCNDPPTSTFSGGEGCDPQMMKDATPDGEDCNLRVMEVATFDLAPAVARHSVAPISAVGRPA